MLKKEIFSKKILPTVFISYKRECSKLVDKIENDIIGKVRICRDTNDLKYKQSVKKFMETIRNHDFAVFVISKQYLESLCCMYEVNAFMKEQNWENRSFFILTDDIKDNIYDKEKHIDIIEFWENRCKSWERKVKEHKLSATSEQVLELNLAQEILNNISKFLAVVADSNNTDKTIRGKDYNIISEYIGQTELGRLIRIRNYFSFKNIVISLIALLCVTVISVTVYNSIPRSVLIDNYNLYDTDICTFVYEGQSRWNRPNGEGTLTIVWNDGEESRYSGNFKSGYPNGRGHYYYIDGTHYYSDNWSWHNDNNEKQMYHLNELGHLDKGMGMHDMDKEGQIFGLYFGEGVAEFSGEWYDGKLNGYGKIHYENPSNVNFSTDLRAKDILTLGEGRYEWKSLYKISDEIIGYAGYFLNDEISSYGEIEYMNGNRFIGLIDENIMPYFGMYYYDLGGYGSFFIGLFDTDGHPYYGSYVPCNDLIRYTEAVEKGEDAFIKLDDMQWNYDVYVDEEVEIINHPVYGILEYGRFNTYTGMMLDGKRTGIGYLPNYAGTTLLNNVFLQPSYHGEFNNDVMDGYGRLFWKEDPNLGCFIGCVLDGNPNGEGTYIFDDGSYIQGEDWNFNNKTIKENFFNTDVDCLYLGMFLNEQRNGHGTQIYCGLGIDIEKTGYLRIYGAYSGNWRNDMPCGYGVFGYTFIEDSEPHIEGAKVTSSALNTIKGVWSWVNEIEFEDIGVYTGMLCNGKRSGYGILLHNDGNISAGIWENDLLVEDELENVDMTTNK